MTFMARGSQVAPMMPIGAAGARSRHESRGKWGRASDPWIIAGLLILGLVVAIAMGALWSYKNSPGAQGEAPERWPAATRLQRDPARPTLVMFAHPMCPCTRASLAELRVLMSEFGGRVDARVLFALPAGVGDDWTTSDSWTIASSIPGVRIERDTEEYESQLFGARTSGQVVMYGADGRLLFHGGITGARGHVGENAGRTRLASLLRDHSTAQVGSPVFGCPLDHPSDEGAAP